MVKICVLPHKNGIVAINLELQIINEANESIWHLQTSVFVPVISWNFCRYRRQSSCPWEYLCPWRNEIQYMICLEIIRQCLVELVIGKYELNVAGI